MSGYSLRPSQFIFTYGVGSIIETSSGPRLIPSFNKWGKIFSKIDISEFQIDISLHKDILDGRVFTIPTNVLLDKKESDEIYETLPFPDWVVCVEHGSLFKYDNNRTKCPDCKGRNTRKQAMRFVLACPDGHLDDVDWGRVINHASSSCKKKIYHWKDKDGTLDDIKITCDCGGETALVEVYKKYNRCKGRFPELETYDEKKCDQNARVVLRGSSMLRIPHLLSLIAIPEPNKQIQTILDRSKILSILSGSENWGSKNWTKKSIVGLIKRANTNIPGTISDIDIKTLEDSGEDDIVTAVSDITEKKTTPLDMNERRKQEFETLKNAAQNGYIPINQNIDKYFRVSKEKVRSGNNAVKHSKIKLRVTPIERLRVVTIQDGYQRLGTEDPESEEKYPVIKRYYARGDERWYPGIEQIGEGIFIDDHDEALNINSKEWSNIFDKNGKIEYHPVFVWWHSLAHRLIYALSLHSGYSSASIREMIYTNTDPSGKVNAGILLYTSQPGGDGSLGGLISKVPEFERVMAQALLDLSFCSNDPFCYQQKIVGGFGSACHACLHLSETSCSYFNRYLDRKILLKNSP